MDRRQYEALCNVLLERFGEPIGDNQGVPTGNKKKDMGNRGFGSRLGTGCCEQCGMMPENIDEDHVCETQPTKLGELDQVAPPGGEKMVKALKKQKGVRNPWAVAWSQYNKKHKK